MNYKTPKVSVIVPIYGVEKLIERCVRSLFEQTLDDIEYLFIDDCTPDKSIDVLLKVLEDYPYRKSQVVIHKMEQNSGQAAVRKWGMQHAKGEYVIHCDSDDWVELEMYDKLYNSAMLSNADIVVCDFCRTDGLDSKTKIKGCHSTNPSSFLVGLIYNRDSWSLCNKLIRSSCFDNLIYPQHNMGEDMACMLQIMWSVRKISYVPLSLYNYYANPNSITRSLSEDQIYARFLQVVKNVELVINFYSKKVCDKRIKSALNYLQWRQKESLLPLVHHRSYYKIWRNTFPNVEQRILLDNRQSVRNRIKCLLIIMHIYPWRNK